MHARVSAVTLDLLRQQLADDGTAQLRVSSDSMAPFIAAGEEVIVEPTKPAGLRVGDVVVLHAEGGFLMHRLLARHKGWLVTRGDGSVAPDRPWPPERLLGRVRAVLKGDGRRLELTPGSAPMGLRLLWRAEFLAYRLAWAVKQRLLGERPCHCSAALARLLTAPSRRWLRRIS